MTLSAYLSKVLNKKPEDIKIFVHQYMLGGGFGGKQDYDEILAAAYCVKEVGRPVKLIQTRESTFATSFPRTPTYHKLKAGLKNGELHGDEPRHRAAAGWARASRSARSTAPTGCSSIPGTPRRQDIDQWSIGGSDHWYDVKNHRVRAWNSDRTTWAVQASALRTVSNSYNMFVVESFMDEVAHALEPRSARVPPVACSTARAATGAFPTPATRRARRPTTTWTGCGSRCRGPTTIPGRHTSPATVGGALRLANCLRVAAGKAGWGARKLAAQHRHGDGGVFGGGAAEPDLGRRRRGGHGRSEDRQFPDQPLTIAMDPGHRGQPPQRQGADRGLGVVGREPGHVGAADLKDGAIEQSNFHEYKPIRLADVPQIDVELIQSGHHPSGVGEPASTVVAPAVANAIYNAVGVRVRHMPITPEAMLEGMKQKA